jgi:hypothetical protein
MLTGLGVVDHAETRAILAARLGGPPDLAYPRDATSASSQLPVGVSVHGTLEPCGHGREHGRRTRRAGLLVGPTGGEGAKFS